MMVYLAVGRVIYNCDLILFIFMCYKQIRDNYYKYMITRVRIYFKIIRFLKTLYIFVCNKKIIVFNSE